MVAKETCLEIFKNAVICIMGSLVAKRDLSETAPHITSGGMLWYNFNYITLKEIE